MGRGGSSGGRGGGGGGGGRLGADGRQALAEFRGVSREEQLTRLGRLSEALASGRVPGARRAEGEALERAMRQELSPVARIAPELRELRQRERRLYQGRLSASDRRRAGQRYGQLRTQARQLLRGVGLSEGALDTVLRLFG